MYRLIITRIEKTCRKGSGGIDIDLVHRCRSFEVVAIMSYVITLTSLSQAQTVSNRNEITVSVLVMFFIIRDFNIVYT